MTAHSVITALLWAAVLWRAPRALRAARQRPLWVALAALGVMMLLSENSLPARLADTYLFPSASGLGKHLMGVVAAAAVLDFIAEMTGRGTGRRERRVRHALALGAAMLLAVFFAAMPRTADGTVVADPASRGAVTAYWLVFMGWLGTSLWLATRLCMQHVRAAPPGQLRTGLAAVGLGTGVGLLYCANKAAFVIGGDLGRTPFGPALTITISTVLLYTALVLIVVGTSWPALDSLGTTLRDHRGLRQLYPLWRALTDANPNVVLGRPPGRREDLLNLRDTHLRLYRRWVEIRDAALVLQDYMHVDVDEPARAAAVRAGRRGTAVDSFVEAVRLEVARRVQLEGLPPAPAVGYVPPDTARMDEEVRWLRQVARAHSSPSVHQLAADLTSRNAVRKIP